LAGPGGDCGFISQAGRYNPGLPSAPGSKGKVNTMRRFVAFIFSLLIITLLIGGPLWYYSLRSHIYRNFHVVRAGVLYRSGQMPLSGLRRVILDHGIKSVVTLRDSRRRPDEPPPDAAEEAWCRDNSINYFRLPPVAWSSTDGVVPAAAAAQQFCDIMRDRANFPVLIHCMAGKHRTGAFCAIYRMEIEHWSNEAAVTEMVDLGYDLLDEHEDVRTYLQGYRPSWRHDKAAQAEAKAGHDDAEN
jgi:tyrosine-protein phosphatase SIW14